MTLEAYDDTRSERCHGTRATMPGWPTRRLTNPDMSGGTGGQAMVRGSAGVQLFHAWDGKYGIRDNYKLIISVFAAWRL